MKRCGFTLIELLVVIAIAGVLFSISAFSLSRAQINSRDQKRKADLQLISSYLEQYYLDNKTYPNICDTSKNPNGCTTPAIALASGLNGNGLVPTYTSGIPNDPLDPNGTAIAKGDYSHAYLYVDVLADLSHSILSSSFYLFAKLENANNAPLANYSPWPSSSDLGKLVKDYTYYDYDPSNTTTGKNYFVNPQNDH